MNKKIIALIITLSLGSAAFYLYQQNSVSQVITGIDSQHNATQVKAAKRSAADGSSTAPAKIAAGQLATSAAANNNVVFYATPSIKAVNTAVRTAISALDFWAKIKADPAISAVDRQYYSAAIHSTCSRTQLENELKKPVDPNNPMVSFPQPPKQVPVISASDPNAALRLAAQAQVKQKTTQFEDFCANFPKVNNAQLAAMWQEGEKLGDPRAKVILQTKEINEKAPSIPDWPISPDGLELKMPVKPPADYFTNIKAALNTQDPAAIQAIGPFLFNTFEEGLFAFGPNNETFSNELRQNLWGIISCDFGANCSSSSNSLANVCANKGLCNIPDVDTYMRNYSLSKADIEQLDRIRPLLVKAIKTGDWADVKYISPLPIGASKNIFGPFIKVSIGNI